MPSPYENQPESTWRGITESLLQAHPLMLAELLDVAQTAWGLLWQTTVGTGAVAARLADLRVPATIVGYFFEVLFSRELQRRSPTLWRGNQSKDEKDVVYLPDPGFSIEIKASGQAGFKIYGNRSYGQKSENALLAKKEKSGYYITVNFFDQTLTLVRFGWIDATDWDPQEAPTGQMAGLKSAVYGGKLVALPGAYRQHTPVRLLDGVGDSTALQFAETGINTIGDLIRYQGKLPPRLDKIKDRNASFLMECV